MSFIKKYELIANISEENVKQFDWEKPSFVERIFSKFKNKGLLITVQPLAKKRSDAQNRWLWGVCYVRIASWHLENFGDKLTPEEIHIYVCTRILGIKYVHKEMFGEEVLVMQGIRTSEMSTAEFMDAKEKIQRFYAEKGCNIPDPTPLSLISDYFNE